VDDSAIDTTLSSRVPIKYRYTVTKSKETINAAPVYALDFQL